MGEVEWDPQCELFFPCGLPGFEQEHRMIPVEIPAQRPLVYLQSLEQAEVCFVCLPVFVVDPGFVLRLSEEERNVLLVEDESALGIGEDVLCLGLLLPCGETVEVNLNTPIVISLRNARGVQCVGAHASSNVNAARHGSNTFRLEPDGRWVRVC